MLVDTRQIVPVQESLSNVQLLIDAMLSSESAENRKHAYLDLAFSSALSFERFPLPGGRPRRRELPLVDSRRSRRSLILQRRYATPRPECR